MILILLYSLVALVTSQRQEQPLCPSLKIFYDAHCTRDDDRSAMVPPQQIPGKRGPVGAKGERGLIGLKGEKGNNGEVNYGRLDEKISQRTREPEFSTSCFHLLQGGETASGFYHIKSSTKSSTTEVFCDMESAGGGWTLVASVHENDIDGKCTIGDKWSSEIGRTGKSRGSKNWENLNTFGTAEGATSSDYKSPAYFNVQASDLMIWHVPNNVKIAESSSRATLKYYTDNQFLTRYGGTLQSLFHQHYPMKTGGYYSLITEDDLTSLALKFNDTASALRSLVNGFYSYTYDFSGTIQNHIGDGGSDMFDSGNKVYYQIGSRSGILVTYNQLYSNDTQGEDVKILASTSHPFSVIMWIGNPARTVSSFGLKVLGNAGADGTGSYSSYSGSLTDGNFRLSYNAFNVYSASDSSICKVFYYVYNEMDWNSVPPVSVSRTPWTSSTDEMHHGVSLSGSPRFVFVGYLLLSKPGGVLVDESEAQSVLRKAMSILKENPIGCSTRDQNDTLEQPIHYLRGSNATVALGIPPNIRRESTPGFIQFRAYSQTGVAYPICPGVKSCRPQSMCLGGMNSAAVELGGACGDFPGWDGSSGDSPNATHPDGFARSLNDQQSSILIFTRQTNDTLP